MACEYNKMTPEYSKLFGCNDVFCEKFKMAFTLMFRTGSYNKSE